jgi:hypothetical protein
VNIQSTHHAGSRKHRIVNGVEADEATTATEFDSDHAKFVYVLQIVPYTRFSMPRIATADHKIPRSTTRKPVGDVSR